jgi:alkyl sulfatase BDS1-like metallo-beta-lactamase superfamily hydrolase
MINLYTLISNYVTSNKYTKHLNTCAHLFNVVTTIIWVRGHRILYVKYFKFNTGLIVLCVKLSKVNR